MFKNRTFLFGLGLGLITAVLLLQLTEMRLGAKERLSNNELEEPLVAETLTKEIVEKWAKDNDYRLVSVTESLYTDADLNEAVSEVRLEAEHQLEEWKHQFKTKGFVVPSGATAKQVAKLLKELSLIEDANVFEDTMIKRKLSTQIKSGYFEFVGQPTMDEIIEQLVQNNN